MKQGILCLMLILVISLSLIFFSQTAFATCYIYNDCGSSGGNDCPHCYTAAEPSGEFGHDSEQAGKVCQIESGTTGDYGHCVPEAEAGEYCCDLHERQVSIAYNEIIKGASGVCSFGKLSANGVCEKTPAVVEPQSITINAEDLDENNERLAGVENFENGKICPVNSVLVSRVESGSYSSRIYCKRLINTKTSDSQHFETINRGAACPINQVLCGYYYAQGERHDLCCPSNIFHKLTPRACVDNTVPGRLNSDESINGGVSSSIDCFEYLSGDESLVDFNRGISYKDICDPGTVVCGITLVGGSDRLSCCIANGDSKEPKWNAVRPEPFAPVAPVYNEQSKIALCPAEKPVLCGGIKESSNYKNMYCCKAEGIKIDLTNPKPVTKDLCNLDEVGCGFVQSAVNALASGIACCRRDKTAEAVPPGGEELPQEFTEEEKFNAIIIADNSQADCDHARQIALPQDNSNNIDIQWIGSSEDGACCGDDTLFYNDHPLEYFIKGDKACIASQVITPNNPGGKNLINSFFAGVPAENKIAFTNKFRLSASQARTNWIKSLKSEKNYIFSAKIIVPKGQKIEVYAFSRDVQIAGNVIGEYIYDQAIISLADSDYDPDLDTITKDVQLLIPNPNGKDFLIMMKKTPAENTGQISPIINDAEVFMVDARKLFFDGTKIYGCMDESEKDSFKATNPQQGFQTRNLIVEDGLKQECAVVAEGKYYCGLSKGGKNEFKLFRKNYFSKNEIITKKDVSVIKDKFISLPVINDLACCSQLTCWSGYSCISSPVPIFVNEREAAFCTDGQWNIGKTISDQFDNKRKACLDNYCFYSNSLYDSDISFCVNDKSWGLANAESILHQAFEGESVSTWDMDEIYCDAGTWTTRVSKIAKILVNLPDVQGTKYTLNCGKYDEVLVKPEYTPFASSIFGEDSKISPYVCVIEYNTNAWKDRVKGILLREIIPPKHNVIIAVLSSLDRSFPSDIISEYLTIVPAEPNKGIFEALGKGEDENNQLDKKEILNYGAGDKNYYTYCLGSQRYQETNNPAKLFIGCKGNWNANLAEQNNFGNMIVQPNAEANLWYSAKMNAVLYSPKKFKLE